MVQDQRMESEQAQSTVELVIYALHMVIHLHGFTYTVGKYRERFPLARVEINEKLFNNTTN